MTPPDPHAAAMRRKVCKISDAEAQVLAGALSDALVTERQIAADEAERPMRRALARERVAVLTRWRSW